MFVDSFEYFPSRASFTLISLDNYIDFCSKDYLQYICVFIYNILVYCTAYNITNLRQKSELQICILSLCKLYVN